MQTEEGGGRTSNSSTATRTASSREFNGDTCHCRAALQVNDSGGQAPTCFISLSKVQLSFRRGLSRAGDKNFDRSALVLEELLGRVSPVFAMSIQHTSPKINRDFANRNLSCKRASALAHHRSKNGSGPKPEPKPKRKCVVRLRLRSASAEYLLDGVMNIASRRCGSVLTSPGEYAVNTSA